MNIKGNVTSYLLKHTKCYLHAKAVEYTFSKEGIYEDSVYTLNSNGTKIVFDGLSIAVLKKNANKVTTRKSYPYSLVVEVSQGNWQDSEYTIDELKLNEILDGAIAS